MTKIVPAQYYANEVCNVVQLIAALVASFIAVVIGVLSLTNEDPTRHAAICLVAPTHPLLYATYLILYL